MNSLLVKGGRVIDPANVVDGLRDVLVRDGKVFAIEPVGIVAAPPGVPEIDARGLWIVPGLIDPHVHLRDPGFPEKETIASGLRAAAAGGFTTVTAMANTNPVNDTPEVTHYMLERAHAAHSARLIPVSAITRGLRGAELVDVTAMFDAGAGLFSDDGIPIDDLAVLRRAMSAIHPLGSAISLHEEDRALSCGGALNAGAAQSRLRVTGYPSAAESERVRRDLELAIESKAAVHIAHVSTRESIMVIREARARGACVTCEVTPHHLALADKAALRWGPNAKMNPPLRSCEDIAALHEAIADGTVDMLATDHAPHDPGSKHLDTLARFFAPSHDADPLPVDAAEMFGAAANGVVGLETALGLALRLVHNSLIDASRLVEMMSLNPAKLLRLDAGTLGRGARADLTVIDPDVEWTVDPTRFHSRSRNTPFAGTQLRGRAKLTVVGGEIVYDARREVPQ